MAQGRPTGPIAFLLPSMAGGGAERVALSVMNYLVEQGYEVDLLLLHHEGQLFGQLHPSIRIVAMGPGRVRQALMPLASYLGQRRPVALQASMWPLTTIAVAARMVARSDCRIVVSDHAILSEQYPGSRLLRASARFFYRHADARIAVSQGAARDIALLTGLVPDDFTVINNPVDFPAESSVKCLPYDPWKGATNRLLNVGMLKYEKQQVMLVDAFAHLVERHPDSALVIVGEGELRDAITQRAVQRGVADKVVLVGYVADPWPYYQHASLFVLASQQEGYGNVLIEALYAGLPVVSTDCPTGPREILGNSEYGILVPRRDPVRLAQALDDALRWPVDKARLRQRALDLSGPAMLERYRQTILGDLAPRA